jgi:hypothetical protein
MKDLLKSKGFWTVVVLGTVTVIAIRVYNKNKKEETSSFTSDCGCGA